MPILNRRTADILLTTLVFGLVCAAIYTARHVILIFVLAVFFAYFINPPVKFLQRHSLFFKNLRGPAVVEVYLAFVILAALAGYSLAPGAARNTTKMIDGIPALLDGLSTGNIASALRGQYGWSAEQEARLRAFLARHKQDIERLVETADGYLSNAAQILVWLFVIPILAIFFLRDGERIADFFIRLLFPVNLRSTTRAVADELHKMLTQYIRAQVVLCVLSFLFYVAAMLLLGFPHAIALGVIGGMLEFIPAIGWLSTLAAIVGVGIVNHSHWIWMMGLLAGWRIIQDYVITPRVMGTHLKLHPLAAVFAVLVGAEIGGVVGMYLAVPVVASMFVIWRATTGEQIVRHPDSNPDAIAAAPSSLAQTATI